MLGAAAKRTVGAATKGKAMPNRFVYQGHEVRVSDPAESVAVTVDGVLEEVAHDDDGQSYSSPRLPYRTFGSLDNLARALGDDDCP